jgi:hypothetical protein
MTDRRTFTNFRKSVTLSGEPRHRRTPGHAATARDNRMLDALNANTPRSGVAMGMD